MRRLRAGQSGPKAGLAEHRYGTARRSGKPPKPRVKEPVVWSWAVQDLASRNSFKAQESIEEERGVGDLQGWAALHESVAIGNEIENDTKLKREFYERFCFFVDRDGKNVETREGERRANSLERAEAKLYLWQRLYS